MRKKLGFAKIILHPLTVTPMQEILFSLKNVSVRNTLHYHDIQILPNTLTFIIGKSGSGKSTLLQLLNGTQKDYLGSIFYRGKNIIQFPPLKLRREIILVPQKIFLFSKSIKENFSECYALLDQPCPNDNEIYALLTKLGIEKDLNNSCDALSGGERHRVYLAICLSLKPTVLLLDEPTSALDHESALTFINLIQTLKNNSSIIMVCHDQSLFTYADNCIKLQDQSAQQIIQQKS